MPRSILTAETEQAFILLAHVIMAESIAKNVDGMADFAKSYRSNLTSREQKIVARFEAVCRKARQDFLQAFAQDKP